MCVLIDIRRIVNSFFRYLAISFENRYLNVIFRTHVCCVRMPVAGCLSIVFSDYILQVYANERWWWVVGWFSACAHNYLALKCCVMAKHMALVIRSLCFTYVLTRILYSFHAIVIQFYWHECQYTPTFSRESTLYVFFYLCKYKEYFFYFWSSKL